MSKKPEVLDEPVHAILLKPTHIQQLVTEGRLPETLREAAVSLPKPQKQAPTKMRLNVLQQAKSLNLPSARKMQHTQQVRARLGAAHASAKLPTGAQKPPCGSCKTAACCRAFVVGISTEEYDSGFYGDVAIQLTPDVKKQLRGKVLSPFTMNAPTVHTDTTDHVLDGLIGDPCPFLQEDNSCGIYEKRPITCRVYSCVGDDRITEGMRDGTEPIISLSEFFLSKYAGLNDT